MNDQDVRVNADWLIAQRFGLAAGKRSQQRHSLVLLVKRVRGGGIWVVHCEDLVRERAGRTHFIIWENSDG